MLDFFTPEHLMAFFQGYAYQPAFVYMFVALFMLAASFGLPIPEELVLISSGLVAYMAHHPEQYPPPYPGAEGVNVFTLCFVSFFAVLCSDTIVYLIGKLFGGRIIKTKFFQKQVAGEGFDRINRWFQKYGSLAAGIFRFTPGLRFPGHLSCGLLGLSLWKFILVDGCAALFSVPTQVYIVGTYGGDILAKIAQFKKYVLIVIAIVALGWAGKKIYQKYVRKTSPSGEQL
ncbi:MAG: DedA family protein [Bacteriovoracaceae bacterium]